MTDLRYPIGKFQKKSSITDAERNVCINHIEEAPVKFRLAVKGLNDQQLNTPYRPEGWTVRQVIHHVSDSHVNAYVRFRLALTEQEPTIKPYIESLWAELHDARTAPIEPSLTLLEQLHVRWIMLLRSIPPADFSRTLMHPDNGIMKLDDMLQLYAWHGQHHVAHITSLRERMGWNL
jgi:uncharacterized damage-inducible protein DinB